ncbi:hypothetical protein FRC06_005396 [Ceratobasidium sp. 370]|nr:hypothetical protein FRC06_005396 [Ceratobasidium sp. 370]
MKTLPLKRVYLKGSAERCGKHTAPELCNPDITYDLDDLHYFINFPSPRRLVLNLNGNTELLSPAQTSTLLALETVEIDNESFDIGPGLSMAAQYTPTVIVAQSAAGSLVPAGRKEVSG